MARRRDYGPVRVLPTWTFLYGMEPQEEITVELEAGKTLHIRLQTVSDITPEGERKLFFELNGQPRVIRVPDRSAANVAGRAEKADPTNDLHVAAPMPGSVASVAVSEGQKVAQGDLLLTLEAMKMETAITADRTGEIARVVARAGGQVDAKDLLIVYAE